MGALRIGFQVWGQFVAWPDLMAIARHLEAAGFDSAWTNDHFLPAAGPDPGRLDAPAGPVFEGWMTLAGFASETRRVGLGILVSGAGYRNPGLVVKMATTLDHLSGGRLTLGIGAGWHEREHRAFGFGYPRLGERIDRLEEQAGAIRGLLDGEVVSVDGRWVQMRDALNVPAPLQPRLPLLVGGSGERRTLGIVARYADVWNGEGDPATIRRKIAVLRGHCAAAGRDPASIRITVGLPPALVRATETEAREALSAILSRHALPAEDARSVASEALLVGPPGLVAGHLLAYADLGVSEVIIDLPAPYDRPTLDALAGPVREALR